MDDRNVYEPTSLSTGEVSSTSAYISTVEEQPSSGSAYISAVEVQAAASGDHNWTWTADNSDEDDEGDGG